MGHFGYLNWSILIVYFLAMAAIGPLFARKNKSTETFFVGNREFPAWLLGLAMFATSISSVTVVAFPADAYKTGYLRLIGAFMLPLGIYMASKIFLPFYRRSRCTSAYEYLEGRFGPGVRTYVACTFLLGQVMRISTILYLVSLVFEQMTGASPYVCIFAGGIVIGIYTISGGIKAIVTAQFIQAFLLWTGAILCFIMVVKGIEGGLSTVISTALQDNKFVVGDPPAGVPGALPQPAPFLSLTEKAWGMMLILGLTNWLGEYSSNQNVIQKYVAAKNPREATKSIWICCFCSVPTWTFFMFLGTCLYVFFKQHPTEISTAISAGVKGVKAESILPHFCVNNLPAGVAGLVVTGILAAAMSASSASVNSISAVSITDIYRRYLAKDRSEAHYVLMARIITATSIALMIGGAVLYYNLVNLTLQDTGTKLAGLLGGGVLGIYMLGFLTKRGSGRAVLIGVLGAIVFSAYILACDQKWITPEMCMGLGSYVAGAWNAITPESWTITAEKAAKLLAKPIDTYYTGLIGHIIAFSLAFGFATFFEREKRDLTNLTVWTTPKEPVDGQPA